MGTEDLGTEYHQQDTDYYCGAACAQMVLEECGAGHLDQDDLYSDNHSHGTAESGWYTAPDGLAWTLNNRQSGRYFVLDALATEDAISRMIVWTVHHYRIAPVALVFGWAHWIVVRGYTTSAEPESSLDTTYTISSFDLNNPWPPTPATAAEPPHSTGDGCGSGGERGLADEHVTYATWQDDYMTGVPAGHWAGRFVAVCDPDPPARPGPREVERPDRPFDGTRILDAEEAGRQARRGLSAHGLDGRERWARSLDAGSPGKPLLVQRLDRLDHFYYVVPFSGGDDDVAVAVDARFGDYRQAALAPAGSAVTALDDDAVLRAVTERRLDLPDRAGRLLVRPELACVAPTYVWRPCRESLSPFFPFRLVNVGRHRLYVRTDGAVFTRLTTDVRGI